MKNVLSIVSLGLLAATFVAGCASRGDYPSASAAFTPQARCERDGGWWRADRNFCEYQTPSGPPSR